MTRLFVLATLCELTVAEALRREESPMVLLPALKTPTLADAADADITRGTEGKVGSCAEVKAAGLCEHAVAKQKCAASCVVLDAVNSTHVAGAAKGEDVDPPRPQPFPPPVPPIQDLQVGKYCRCFDESWLRMQDEAGIECSCSMCGWTSNVSVPATPFIDLQLSSDAGFGERLPDAKNTCTIVMTPAGRADRMGALLRAMIKYHDAGVLKEWHLWNNTHSEADAEFLQALTTSYSFINLVPFDPDADQTRRGTVGGVNTFWQSAQVLDVAFSDCVLVRLDDDIVALDSPEQFQAYTNFIRTQQSEDQLFVFMNTLNNMMSMRFNQLLGGSQQTPPLV